MTLNVDKITLEKQLPNGQSVTLENGHNTPFFVACWNEDGSCHWDKTFNTLDEALSEYRRFT